MQFAGQRSARMAMYCAVQGPMPGRACSAASVAAVSAVGDSSNSPLATAWASA